MIYKARSLAGAGERPGRVTMTLVLLLGMAFVLGACNMMRGMGQDVQAAGEVVEDTAEDVQN